MQINLSVSNKSQALTQPLVVKKGCSKLVLIVTPSISSSISSSTIRDYSHNKKGAWRPPANFIQFQLGMAMRPDLS